jgi:hypothetical protein
MLYNDSARAFFFKVAVKEDPGVPYTEIKKCTAFRMEGL